MLFVVFLVKATAFVRFFTVTQYVKKKVYASLAFNYIDENVVNLIPSIEQWLWVIANNKFNQKLKFTCFGISIYPVYINVFF